VHIDAAFDNAATGECVLLVCNDLKNPEAGQLMRGYLANPEIPQPVALAAYVRPKLY
jgi:hypothetical protein